MCGAHEECSTHVIFNELLSTSHVSINVLMSIKNIIKINALSKLFVKALIWMVSISTSHHAFAFVVCTLRCFHLLYKEIRRSYFHV